MSVHARDSHDVWCLYMMFPIFQILNLDWSSGIESLKCVGRVDLALNGSFADMILVPNATAMEGYGISSLFVLSNPGQLHFYDDSCLSTLMSQPEKKHSVPALQYPELIPTVEPYMTVAKLTPSEVLNTFKASARFARTGSLCVNVVLLVLFVFFCYR